MNRKGVHPLASTILAFLLLVLAGLVPAPVSTADNAATGTAGTVILLPTILHHSSGLTPIMPETTKVLPKTTTQNLSSISGDGSDFTFSASTPALEGLAPGDLIVSEPTNLAPDGFLRKVLAVTSEAGTVVVRTSEATLEEAMQQGEIRTIQVLQPSQVRRAEEEPGVMLATADPLSPDSFIIGISNVVLYDDDGNLATKDDQITAKGSISFEQAFEFVAVIRGFTLRELSFVNRATERASLEIGSKVKLGSLKKEVELARYTMQPIVLQMGPLPVTVTPVLTVHVGLDGSASIGVTTGVTQEATLRAGVSYAYGQWSPVSTFSNEFDFQEPTLHATCHIKGYAGAELTMKVYGVVGPKAELNAYLELDADLFRVPWWELYGGFEALVGVKAAIFGKVIASVEMPVLDYRRLLAQSGSPGVQIAFFSDRTTPGAGEIFMMNSDGSEPTQVSSDLQVFRVTPDGSPGVISYGWSKSAQQFFYGDSHGAGLHSVNADGTGKTLLMAPVGHSAVSPSGQRLAVATIGSIEIEPQIAVMNSDGSGYREITDSPYRNGHPTWSSDGEKIAYARQSSYWEIDAGGGTPRMLFPAGLVPSMYECAWSPAEPLLVCNTLTQTPALYLVDLDTQTATKLTDSGGWHPSWSPDGNYITFDRDQIWVINVDGTGLKQLTTEGKNVAPIWVPAQ